MIIIYAFLLEPLHKKKVAMREVRERKEALLSRYNALLSQKESTQKEIKSLIEQEKILKNSLFKGNSPSLAAAEIQSRLHELSRGLSLNIISEKVNNPEKIDTFSLMLVEIVVKGNMKNMMQFIFNIENSAKYMRIKEMKLRVTKRVRADEGETIEAKIVVEGFILEKNDLA